MPPINWLRAVVSFMIRPAAKAPTIRGTRISRVSAWTRTSTNSAPVAYINLSPLEPPVGNGVPAYKFLIKSGFAPDGRYSAYSSIAPTPRRLKLSSRFSCRAVALLPTVDLSPATAPSDVGTDDKSFARIASQAFITAEHALAVVFDPPATGAGGRLLSPSSGETDEKGMPSSSAAIWPITV